MPARANSRTGARWLMFCVPATVKFSLPGLAFRVGDELRQRRHRQGALDCHDLRAGADVGDRYELLDRIEGQFLHLRRQVDVGRGREQQGVAIRCRCRDLTGAERAAGARTILDHESLPEFCSQMLRAEAGHHVGIAAGAERHDDGHRTGRPVSGVERAYRHSEDGDDRQQERQTQWTVHVIPYRGGTPVSGTHQAERRALPSSMQVRSHPAWG